MNETCKGNERIRDLPKPQKVMFYCGKTHILTNPPGPLKVHKISSKWTPEEPPRPPKTLRRHPKELQKQQRKLHQKNEQFRTQENLVSTMNGKRVKAWHWKNCSQNWRKLDTYQQIMKHRVRLNAQ